MFIGVLAAVWLCAAGAPERAHAFVGEDEVIDPITKTLTPAAEKVIKTGDFIPETITKAKAFGGAATASGAASVFEAGTVLPGLGAVVSFGVGTIVGSEICKVIGIEGCWYFGSEGADPASGGVWKYDFGSVTGVPDFEWYWTQSGGSLFSGFISGQQGTPAECGLPVPGGTEFYTLGVSGTACENPKPHTATRVTPGRYAMSNREIDYHAADDPGIGNYAHTPSAEWPKKTAAAIQADEDGAKVGQSIAHAIDPAVKDPYANYVNIPSCDELTWGACKAALEGKGLEPIREDLDWSEVTTDVPDAVQFTLPAPSTEVVVPSKVKVITNPDEDGMPAVVPQPEPHETYEHYAARLNPALAPERLTVTDANADPDAGPDAVLGTSPAPGSKSDPATSTPVEVRANPHDAPAPVGGGTCGATVGAINWNPLNQPLGDRFPFGVFAFFVGWIGEWTASDQPPKWKVTLVPSGVFGSDGIDLGIDLEAMLPLAEVMRVVFLFASFVGLLWFLGTAAMKIQGDNS